MDVRSISISCLICYLSKFQGVSSELCATCTPYAVVVVHGAIKYKQGHTNLILCRLGQNTFQAASVGRLNNDNNSHVISGSYLCVAGSQMCVFNS